MVKKARDFFSHKTMLLDSDSVRVRDKRQGHGVYFFQKGKRFEGDFQNDKVHGEGTLYYEDFTEYKGR